MKRAAASIAASSVGAPSDIGGEGDFKKKGKGRAANKKLKLEKGECRCSLCSVSSLHCQRWGATEVDKKSGEMLPSGPFCADCRAIYSLYRSRYPDPGEFVEWGRTAEGVAEIAERMKANKTDSETATHPESVAMQHNCGARVKRELYIANKAEFQSLVGKAFAARMPALPQFNIPKEDGLGEEMVYGWAVGTEILPLRKFEIYTDCFVGKVQRRLSFEACRFKAQGVGVLASCAQERLDVSQQGCLVSNPPIVTFGAWMEKAGLASSSAPSKVSASEALGGSGQNPMSTPSKNMPASLTDMPADDADDDGPAPLSPGAESHAPPGISPWAVRSSGSAVGDDLYAPSAAWSDSGIDNDDDNIEDIAKMKGPSRDIWQALQKRLNLTKILNNKQLGRSIKGSKAYLTNGKLDDGDKLLLQRHLQKVVPAWAPTLFGVVTCGSGDALAA